MIRGDGNPQPEVTSAIPARTTATPTACRRENASEKTATEASVTSTMLPAAKRATAERPARNGRRTTGWSRGRAGVPIVVAIGYARNVVIPGADTALGSMWIDVATQANEEPLVISLPYREIARFDPAGPGVAEGPAAGT